MSETGRNWKSPNDRTEQHYEMQEDLEHETPAPHQKCTLGVEIMPEITEENEEELEDEEEPHSKKKKSTIKDDIKRLSVISSKLEEIIDREDQKHSEIILDVNRNTESMTTISSLQSNVTIFQEKQTSRHPKICCCSPYRKFRYRRRLKSFCDTIFSLAIKPVYTSVKIASFYPCLLSVVHSMFSPLIYLNFMPILANEDSRYGNLPEIAFMLSITAFAYICFLITLPWIAEISKRKMRYLYIIGAFISAMAVYSK